jgi:hypothetical protein
MFSLTHFLTSVIFSAPSGKLFYIKFYIGLITYFSTLKEHSLYINIPNINVIASLCIMVTRVQILWERGVRTNSEAIQGARNTRHINKQ